MQDAISAQLDAAIVEEKKAEAIAQSDRSADRRIAFASDRNGDYSPDEREIYTMRSDGTDVRQLTLNGAVDQTSAWSPDGTRIAFASTRNGVDIFTMRSDGTDVRQLTRNGAEDWSPAWFPDGTRMGPGWDPDGTRMGPGWDPERRLLLSRR